MCLEISGHFLLKKIENRSPHNLVLLGNCGGKKRITTTNYNITTYE